MPPLQLTIPCELDQAYSAMIVDDGRVAYAYLMQYEDTIADVWLYNLEEAPENAYQQPGRFAGFKPSRISYKWSDGKIRNQFVRHSL